MNQSINPVPCGERWEALVGSNFPAHEISRIKTFLNGTGVDDLVYTDWYGTQHGVLGEAEDLVEQLVIVGADGAGRRLRRGSYRVDASKLLEDVQSAYLCKRKVESGAEIRYVLFDHTREKNPARRGEGGSPLLICRRDEFLNVAAELGMGGGAGGTLWRGEREGETKDLLDLDESAYSFADGLLSRVFENTVGFLTGPAAERLLAWDVAPRRGVILHGRPGNGKTVLSRLMAKRALEAGLNVVILDAYALSGGVGEALNLAASRAPALILMDDIDVFCGQRSTEDAAEGARPAIQRSAAPFRRAMSSLPHAQKFLADMLEFLDGIEVVKGYVLLTTTNDLNGLDPALIRSGRLDVHIGVNGPSREQREVLLRSSIRHRSVNSPSTTSAAEVLDGCSYSDIAEVAKRYKIGVIAKHESIVSDEGVLNSIAREYAAEIGALKVSG